VQSLNAIFKPKSIAIIGATTRRGSIGRELINNLFSFEFNGMIFPVNPRYDYIHSTKCYPTVLSIPDPVDLAVVVVPKEHVLMAVEDCGRKGVKGLVIITAGFKEVGGKGEERERELAEIAKKYDMRMVGPNCMGVIAATKEVQMNATWKPGVHDAERGVGRGDHPGRAQDEPRVFLLRQRWQQGGRVRHRSARVLGERREHRRHRTVPRIVRRPHAVHRAVEADLQA
jgi:acyl-CoA synthetase (NDP forming)